MKQSLLSLSVSVAASCHFLSAIQHCQAFSPNVIQSQSAGTRTGLSHYRNKKTLSNILNSNYCLFATDTGAEDCGCATIFEGQPSNTARRNINHRNAISKVPIYRIDGTITDIDDILGGENSKKNEKTSLVVFLRSLG
mmetsp:Transcript_1800/g.2401  ORF Transcript_1800/g.2401 Transcript_1800/m.2401 type:complete len:138 (+) Transcript_1800:104-517(+)